jgi:hypothetical protein
MTEDIRSLTRQLQTHQKNLNRLEEQAAQYGAPETPLSLLNGIDAEKEAIAYIEQKLARLQASEAGSPAPTSLPIGERAILQPPETERAPGYQRRWRYSRRNIVIFCIIIAAIMSIAAIASYMRISYLRRASQPTSTLCLTMLGDSTKITTPSYLLATRMSSNETISATKTIFLLNTATKDMISIHEDAVVDWRTGGTMTICARNYDAVLINPKLPKNFRAFIQYKIDNPSSNFSVGIYKAGDPPNNFSVTVTSKNISFFPPPDRDTTRGTTSENKALLAQQNITADITMERKDGVLTIYSNGQYFTISEDEKVDQYNYFLLTASSTEDTSEYRFPGKVIIEDIVIIAL